MAEATQEQIDAARNNPDGTPAVQQGSVIHPMTITVAGSSYATPIPPPTGHHSARQAHRCRGPALPDRRFAWRAVQTGSRHVGPGKATSWPVGVRPPFELTAKTVIRSPRSFPT